MTIIVPRSTDKQDARRVLVTGSRDWKDDYLIWIHLDMWRQIPIVVVHGACPTGADNHADEWCLETNTSVERHPADWSRGRRAGPERNAAMVALGADVCLAYIGPCTSPRCNKPGVHPSHGATGCADLAESAGITTLRYYAPSIIEQPGGAK